MSRHRWIRRSHRVLSIVFTVAVLIDTVVAVTVTEPPTWVFLLPVAPVLLLMVSGLYLFALPHTAERRAAPA